MTLTGRAAAAVITNDLSSFVNVFLAEINKGTRCGSAPRQIEDFHRSFKQLTGSEKCQCRKARSQRNHLACCYHAWVSLQVKVKKVN